VVNTESDVRGWVLHFISQTLFVLACCVLAGLALGIISFLVWVALSN
jgi:phosphotransferase system  glucose/maltose/N-acetylglucosamine-specific IIC component